jgi:RalA-binding protein 1
LFHAGLKEEGIYRLSGSSAVVQALKERFNVDGDVDLLALDDFHDIHAITGLHKLWLRELTTPILTKDLQPEFLVRG